MAAKPSRYLSKREQQIMEAVYRQGAVTAAELETLLPNSPSNATVRKLLRILEERGQVTHTDEGGKFVYRPATPKAGAAKSALTKLKETFFGGSVKEVVAALLDDDQSALTEKDLAELRELIEKARQEAELRQPQ